MYIMNLLGLFSCLYSAASLASDSGMTMVPWITDDTPTITVYIANSRNRNQRVPVVIPQEGKWQNIYDAYRRAADIPNGQDICALRNNARLKGTMPYIIREPSDIRLALCDIEYN